MPKESLEGKNTEASSRFTVQQIGGKLTVVKVGVQTNGHQPEKLLELVAEEKKKCPHPKFTLNREEFVLLAALCLQKTENLGKLGIKPPPPELRELVIHTPLDSPFPNYPLDLGKTKLHEAIQILKGELAIFKVRAQIWEQVLPLLSSSKMPLNKILQRFYEPVLNDNMSSGGPINPI